MVIYAGPNGKPWVLAGGELAGRAQYTGGAVYLVVPTLTDDIPELPRPAFIDVKTLNIIEWHGSRFDPIPDLIARGSEVTGVVEAEIRARYVTDPCMRLPEGI